MRLQNALYVESNSGNGKHSVYENPLDTQQLQLRYKQMARPKSNSAKIVLKAPAGVRIPRAVVAEAAAAAQAIVDEHTKVAAAANALAEQGLVVDPAALAELVAAGPAGSAAPTRAKKRAASKKAGKRAAKKAAGSRKGKRRRTVLSDDQRAELVEFVKGGATIKQAATKFEVSPQTVMTIKKAAGLVQSKKAAKKKATKKKAAAKK